jgi:hypothetical protein
MTVSTGSPEPGVVEFQFTERAKPVVDQDALAAGYPVDIDPDEYDAADSESLGGNDPEAQ